MFTQYVRCIVLISTVNAGAKIGFDLLMKAKKEFDMYQDFKKHYER